MGSRILIVDDEESIRYSLKGILEDEGHAVIEACTGEQGLAMAREEQPDLVFLDIWLTGMDGLDVLDALNPAGGGPPVVMISGHGTIETAVKAIKKGAFDFIEKPLSLDKVIIAADKAMEFSRLKEENRRLRSRIESGRVTDITGNSPPVAELREQMDQVGPTDAWVLITGENGTGKEIVARAVHRRSARKDRPLVAVNCAAIPEELIESELFGHEKGAFTGADSARTGKFEMAHQGILFLDEIGDMSLKTQAKILRILQEQSFERVGGGRTVKVDVRVIAATNKDLEQEIEAGRFRQDLYYRLRVFPLHVPPLRERGPDIPLLIEEFVEQMAKEHGFRPISFSRDALNALCGHPWPGNVRELKNFVERMHIMHAGKQIQADMLPREFAMTARPVPAGDNGLSGEIQAGPVDFKAARAEFEAAFLKAKLAEYDGNVSRLAEAIGLERSYIYRKLKASNLAPSE